MIIMESMSKSLMIGKCIVSTMTMKVMDKPLIWDENGVLYIVRGYKPWMKGKVIPDKYVVRPRNHMWCGKYGGECF